jgi:Gas vesicle synthesis protein GvpL/GvpF
MLYMYAVVDGLPAAWHPPPAVTPTASVERHHLGPLLILGSTLDAVPPANPRTLALHHDVVASALDALAVLPFRYGTAVADGQHDAWLRAHHAALAPALAQVRGCVEMSVKLLRLDSGETQAGPEEGELRGLAEQLVDRAKIEQWRYRPAGSGGNVIASVAFLLPRAQLGDFLARIAPIASRAVGVAVVPTGPWPAYSFVPAFDRPPLAVVPSAAPSPLSARRAAG